MIPHHTTPHHTTPHHTTPHHTTPHHTTPYHTTPYYTTHHTTPHHTTRQHIALHRTTLHHTTLHNTAPHYCILHHIIAHHSTSNHLKIEVRNFIQPRKLTKTTENTAPFRVHCWRFSQQHVPTKYSCNSGIIMRLTSQLTILAYKVGGWMATVLTDSQSCINHFRKTHSNPWLVCKQ